MSRPRSVRRARRSSRTLILKARRLLRHPQIESLEQRLVLATWSGDIPNGTVWPAGEVQQIIGNVRVPAGATLTIEPGATVKFNAVLDLGLTVEGTLSALGTAAEPILITSMTDDTGPDAVLGTADDLDSNGNGPSTGGPAQWQRIIFAAGSTGSQLDHVDVRFGGENVPAMIHVVGELAMSNSVLRSSGTSGIRIQASNPVLTDNTLLNNVSVAMSMDLASNPVISGVTLAGNSINALSLDGGTLPGDATWDDSDIVYRLTGDVTVPQGTTLSIAAGQVIKTEFFNDRALIVAGTLIADGTAEKPIVITSDNDDSVMGDTTSNGPTSGTPGESGGIRFNPGSTGNLLNFVEVRNAGDPFGRPAVLVDSAELTMRSSVIRNSGQIGLRLQSSDSIITDTAFVNCAAAAISMDLASNPTITNPILTNNTVNAVALDSGTLPDDTVWGNPDIVYRMLFDITVPTGKTLTIVPGKVIKAASGSGTDLIVDGTLVAAGTPSQPIIWTSDRDDSALGDTNNNGISAGQFFDWQSIHFSATSTDNLLDHVEVRFAGANVAAALVASGAELTVTNSLVRLSAGHSMVAQSGALVTLQNNLFLKSNGNGIRAESGANVIATNNTIDGGIRGVGADGAATSLALTNNLITNNTFSGIARSNGAAVTASFNDVFNPGAPGGDYEGLTSQTGTNGNTSVDPKYFNRASEQFQLRAGSPAIDSATSQGAPGTDFDGNPRFDDTNVPDAGGGVPAYFDRGAYERQEASFSNVDLVTSNVSGPTVGVQDAVATITWTVQNIGDGVATAPWHDAVYLSADRVWSPDDRFMGDVVRNGDLGPGQQYAGTTNVTLSNVLPGNYYFIVRTNSRSELFEGVAALNNATSSGDSVSFSMPTLTVGVPAADQFTAAGDAKFYQITVAAGQSLALALDSAAASGSTELYIRRGAVPTRTVFDFSSANGLVPDQNLTVPLTQPGTYYILAYPRAGSASAAAYTLTATLPGLDVTAVSPATGANVGRVTVAIRGAQFTPDTTVSIISPSNVVIPAVAIQFTDATRLYATFDLAGLPTGIYDVRVNDGVEHDTIQDAFSVTTGTPAQVRASIIGPSAVRPGREGRITVEYVNEGDTDAIAPLMIVKAENAILRWPESSIFQGDSVQILGTSPTGPAGILPPGARHRVELVFRPTIEFGPTNFAVSVLNSPSTVMDWAGLKANLRPADVPLDAWDAIYANFTSSVGTTLGQYQAVLAENATYLSQLGKYTVNADRMLAFELAQAGNALGDPKLMQTVDVLTSEPGLSLTFGRSFMQPISGRYALGSLGRGWVHSWDITAAVDANGDVTIRSGVSNRLFSLHPDNFFASAAGDTGTLRHDGTGYLLRELDGTIKRFAADGKLDFVEDANGNRITAVYTSGRLTSLAHSNGDAMTIGYNAQGRINQVTDADGQIVTYSYDASGEHLVSVIGPLGTVEYAYAIGTTPAREHALLSVESVEGKHLLLTYDNRGRVESQELDGGTHAVTYTYDAVGGVTASNATGTTRTVFYDDVGQVAQVRDGLGLTRIVRDAALNTVTVTLPDGSIGSFSYDQHGNLISQDDPQSLPGIMAYDPVLGRLLSVTDARGGTTHHRYDENGNLLTTTDPAGAFEQFAYDVVGNVVESVNRRGQSIQYTRDAQGFVTRKDYADGSHVDFVFDERHNLESATDASGTTTLQYDSANRLVRIEYPTGRFLQIAYDSVGRRSRLDDQSGILVNYAYDAVGLLAGLTDGGGASIVEYTYDEVGRLARKDLGNATATTYEYDATGQLIDLRNLAPNATVLSRYQYAYDDLGRVVELTTLEGVTTYTYDARGQLATIELPGGRTIAYSYDAAGNRISVNDDGDVTSYATNNLNEYVTIDGETRTYDADGNLVSRIDGGSTWIYTYDAENRLLSATGPDGTWQYEYDVFGNRAAATHNGERVEYLVDPDGLANIVAEYDESGALLTRYTHGLGLVSQFDPQDGNAYYGFDPMGNTSELTGPSGGILNQYTYLPFGEVQNRIEARTNPFQFGGEAGLMFDGHDLSFVRARYYEAAAGRFVQPDPVGQAGGINRYVYAHNDPVQKSDPTGLITINWGGGFFTGSWLPMVRTASGLWVTEGMEHMFAANAVREGIKRINWVNPARSALREGINQLGNLIRTNPGALRPSFASFQPAGMATRLLVFLAEGSAAAVGVAIVVGTIAGVTTGVVIDNVISAIKPLAHFRDSMFDAFCLALGLCESTTTSVLTSRDPNAIDGPAGFGSELWISPDQPLPYTIHFENSSDADVAAQEVFLTNQLDPGMDWTTFEFGDIHFGNTNISIPAGRQVVDTQAEIIDANGIPLWVRINAELNLGTGVVSWTFRSLDPGTGELPLDAFAGFLPPNDDTHRGEGSVSYFIRQLAGRPNGTVIDNQASIVFDVNDAILTNTHLNTIDDNLPTSAVAALPPSTSLANFPVSWSGSDDGGSGIGAFDVYVSDNGGPFVLWLNRTAATNDVYPGESGHSYQLYSVAYDNVGHVESPPAGADAEIVVLETSAGLLEIVLVSEPTVTDVLGQVATLPASATWIDEWQSPWIEVWAYADAGSNAITAAVANISYNSAYFVAQQPQGGPAFATFTSNVNATTGRIQLDASAATAAVGQGNYVLVGRVRLTPQPDDGLPIQIANPTPVEPVAEPWVSIVDDGTAQVTLVGQSAAAVPVSSPPATDLFPFLYDLDDDGRVGFGDFAIFASVFFSNVSAAAPASFKADFTLSGRVDFGDFSLFSANFLNVPGSTPTYPANFPAAWLAGDSLTAPLSGVMQSMSATFSAFDAPGDPVATGVGSAVNEPEIVERTAGSPSIAIALPVDANATQDLVFALLGASTNLPNVATGAAARSTASSSTQSAAKLAPLYAPLAAVDALLADKSEEWEILLDSTIESWPEIDPQDLLVLDEGVFAIKWAD